MAGNNQILRKN